ncbi:unnamed protein product [Cuscuta campestris]|uniref:MBD domain-containing protein n=1 Tax=Cuscuta campestris TaxID=132261 RepID=A0A484NNH7_9ASTE|nr:unnamed protein product [Cuscuta campestris]
MPVSKARNLASLLSSAAARARITASAASGSAQRRFVHSSNTRSRLLGFSSLLPRGSLDCLDGEHDIFDRDDPEFKLSGEISSILCGANSDVVNPPESQEGRCRCYGSEFHLCCELIRDGNDDAIPNLAYYEVLLWIKTNNHDAIGEVCYNLALYDGEDKHTFLENYLLAMCDGDYCKELFLQLANNLDITKVTTMKSLEKIFKALGRFMLVNIAERCFLDLKATDIEEANISTLIFAYCKNIPNLAVEDIVLKFKHLHAEMDLTPTSAQYEKLIKFFCELLKVHVALDLVDQMHKQSLTLSKEAFHVILDACEKSREYNLVRRMHSIITSHNLQPNSETFRMMINLSVKMKDFEGAYNLVSDLKKYNLTPTASMYNAIMVGCFQEKNIPGGLNVLKEMEEAGVKPDSQTFSYLISRCNCEDHIIKFFKEMTLSGVHVTTHVYMALINAYASCGQFEKAKQVIFDKGIPAKNLNEVKSVLVSALAVHGEVSDALEMYKKFKQDKCNLEPRAVFSLIDHLQSDGELSRLLQLLDELDDQDQWVRACFKVVSYCVRHEDLSSAIELLRKLKDIFCNDELALEFLFDEVFYRFVEKEPRTLDFGWNMLQAIKKDFGLCPSRKCLDFLLCACISARDVASCSKIWREYQEAGIPYNSLSYLRLYQTVLALGLQDFAEEILSEIPKEDPHVWLCGGALPAVEDVRSDIEEVAQPSDRFPGLNLEVPAKMVAGKSPETLPSGWSEYVKVIKGRNVKHYVDPVSGYVFFSKPDAVRYVQTGDILKCLKRPKRRDSLLETDNKSHKIQESSDNEVSQNEKSTNSEDEEGSIMQISEGEDASVKQISDGTGKQPSNVVSSVSVEGNLVGEIPPGWVTEIKTRVHAYGIRRYSHYVDPVSGYVFRSKKDVMRYVQTGDIEKCAVRPKKRDSMSGTNNQSHEIKESSGDGVSQSEKPTNSEGEEASIKQITDGRGKQPSNIVSSVSVEGNLEDGIPPGWVKEIKTTRHGSRIRRDALYVDPVSGYVFSSKKDVMRYVETGDINKCVKRPQKRGIVSRTNNETASLLSASSSDKEMGQNNSPDGDGEAGVTVSGSATVPESNSTKSKKKNCLSTPSERALQLAARIGVGTETTNMSSAQTPNGPTLDIHDIGNSVHFEVNSSAVTSSSGAKANKAEPETENRYPRSNSSVVNTNEAKPEAENRNPRSSSTVAKTNEAEQKAESRNPRSSPSVAKTNEAKPETKNRNPRSSPAKLKIENRNPRSSSTVAKTNEAELKAESRYPRLSPSVAKTNEAKQETENRNPRLHPSVAKTNEAKPETGDRNPRLLPSVAKTNEAKPEEDPRLHPTVAKTIEAKPEAENRNSRLSSSVAKTNKAELEVEGLNPKMEGSGPRYPFGDCWSDPCLEFAFKTLTGAEPETENRNLRTSSSVTKTNKADPEAKSRNPKSEDSAPVFPFGDGWPDPCLEFAFKTLTGAIPVEDFLQCRGPRRDPLFSDDMTSQSAPPAKRPRKEG